ncbi:hypothetical protein ACJ2A9_05340 [Anaerobacillus sp. MEB173]|uniref:hypothetical protein n=1 Tax=Anaerobacillus sp. MEB173 TaxID=3383345 RepID=UPI003F8EB4E4
MKKTIIVLLFLLGIFIGLIGSLYINKPTALRETLISFPVDEDVSYLTAITTLSLLHLDDEDEYTLKWELSSSLDQLTYLRHDISLLFEDGRLRDTMSSWEENSESLYNKKEIKGEDSGHFEAISFHHSENHYPDDLIKSRQQMSYDEIYIIDSPLSPLQSFRQPKNSQDIEGKKLLDNILNQQLQHIWQQLLTFYNIPTDKYELIPLTQLHQHNDEPLMNLNHEQSTIIIGALWESLYKDYFLGVKKNNGTTISPIGSSIPLILIHHTGSHFIVLFQTIDGEKVQILRNLSF